MLQKTNQKKLYHIRLMLKNAVNRVYGLQVATFKVLHVSHIYCPNIIASLVLRLKNQKIAKSCRLSIKRHPTLRM